MSDDKIKVEVIATSSGLSSGMAQAASTIESSTSQLKSLFSGMESHIAGDMSKMRTSVMEGALSMKTALVELGFAIGSGALIKEAVQKNLEYADSLQDIRRVMGGTTEQAGVLSTALTIIGASAESYLSANLKLTKALKTNEESLTSLGIVTRDANGSLLEQSALFQNALSAMLDYKEGTDRNEFALAAFGKGAKEAMQFLELTSDVMQDAARIATQYGLAIGEGARAETEQFGRELRKSGLIFDAVKLKIGQELLPTLVQLAGWFSQAGPGAINVISISLKALIHVFEGLTLIARDTFNFLELGFKTIATTISAIFTGIWKAMTGDFSGAKEAIQQGLLDLKGHLITFSDDVVEYHSAAEKRVTQLWSSAVPKITEAIKEGTKEFKSQAEQVRDHQKALGEGIVSTTKIQVKLREEAEAQLAKQQEQHGKHITQALLSEFKIREKAESEMYALAKAEADQLADDEAAAAQRARQARMAAKDQEAHDAAATQQRLGKDIVNAAIKQQKDLEAAAKAQADFYASMTRPAMQAFNQMTIGILRGNQTIAQATKKMGQNIVLSYANMALQAGQTWIENQIAMTAVQALESAKRIAFGEGEATAGLAAQAGGLIKSIGNLALQAFSGAYSALVGIPYIGPFIAPAAGASAMATVGGVASSIVSAAGGYEVPQDMLAQVHKNEMILPSALSDRIRNMTDQGGGGGQASPVNLHVHALDAKSVARLFAKNGQAIADVLRQQARNGRLGHA